MVMTNNAAAKILTNFLLHELDTVKSPQVGTALMVAIEEMERMRKVEAVVGKANTIRCKECKYGVESFGKLRCSVNCRTMKPDDYCSYGEVE